MTVGEKLVQLKTLEREAYLRWQKDFDEIAEVRQMLTAGLSDTVYYSQKSPDKSEEIHFSARRLNNQHESFFLMMSFKIFGKEIELLPNEKEVPAEVEEIVLLLNSEV